MKGRIMIVEDESIFRLDLSMMISDAGYQVVAEAENGEKAIELAYSSKPDLIIMDIKMPKLNGLKASEIISNKIDTPILLLTAYSQPEFVNKAKEANVVGYLVKPVSEVTLMPAVEIAMQQGKRFENYKKNSERAEAKLENRKIVEKAKGILMERLGLNEDEAYQKMRKYSMNKQVTLVKVARQILKKFG